MNTALALALAVAASHGAAPAAPALAPAREQIQAARAVTPALLRSHVKFIASDLTEGRAPGTRGDRIAEEYVATQLEALGLVPAAPGGGFFQKVPLVGVETSVASPPRFESAKGSVALAPEEFVANAGVPREAIRLDGAEVVFVGYGIVAPEYRWDDYAGADVKGKVVLVMNNDPEDDPSLFAGKTRLYYGRWTYKYEEAARHGAASAIIIHTTPSASYPWTVVQNSWAGPQFELAVEPGPRVQVRMWVTEDASRRIAALAGRDLDALREAANRRGFTAVPLAVRLSVALAARVTRAETENVIARLPGSDPARAGEAVLFTAHHDHLGTKPEKAVNGDAIFNGAVDNASGVSALLGIARAAAALPRPPARSLVFAAVGAEEQGLLGSEWLADHTPVPVGKIAAVINMDGMNVFGRTRDVTVIGLGKSTLDAVIAGVARWQGRTISGDAFPEKGTFYRSDHFSLAKTGIPAVYVHEGVEFVGRPPGWGRDTVERWEREHYHQPSDEWRDDYDLTGMVDDTQLLFFVGVKVAQARDMPRWNRGDEFEAARTRALKAAAGAP